VLPNYDTSAPNGLPLSRGNRTRKSTALGAPAARLPSAAAAELAAVKDDVRYLLHSFPSHPLALLDSKRMIGRFHGNQRNPTHLA
jgi:hypothetical protein